MAIINPGFKSPNHRNKHIPPGQSVVTSWPVLTYGPTPLIDTKTWSLEIDGEVKRPIKLDWKAFNALPRSNSVTDIHCVTRWSKLGMPWEGVDVEELIKLAGGLTDEAMHVVASCYGGYTTNLPVEDIREGQALIATHADGKPLTPEHGGPARLFVPHLYFWKSAKYVNKLTFLKHDYPGFWEVNGYHNYGDPWLEQRYDTDL
jgi:DMSO/TMAO reductase YedYZ molybdopterin-dependent catalytic subunit